MAFDVPTFEAQRAALLRDVRNWLPSADTGPDSDWFVRASALAGALQGLSQHQAWIERQIFPDVCDSDSLERHASQRGLTRKAPAAATGVASVTVAADIDIAAGTELRSDAGLVYQVTTTTACTAGAATAVPIQAAVAGAASNMTAGAGLTPSVSIAGLQSIVSGDITGGADIESDDGLRGRLLDVIRRPPAGGAAYDYVRWALEVPGVVAATVHPLRRGAGTVDVSILAAGGLPSSALVAQVQAYIDVLRPVTASCLAVAPSAVPVAVTLSALSVTGTTAEVVAPQIAAALQAYFGTFGPGGTVLRNRIVSAIADVPGVLDFTLAAPAGNVATTVDAAVVQLPTLGAVTLP